MKLHARISPQKRQERHVEAFAMIFVRDVRDVEATQGGNDLVTSETRRFGYLGIPLLTLFEFRSELTYLQSILRRSYY